MQSGQGQWGAYIQGADDFEGLVNEGAALSTTIGCAVHYPAWDKPFFECKHGVLFPRYAIKGAVSTGNWGLIKEQHNLGIKES